MAERVVIINTGCANISSVKFALMRLDANVHVSEDIDVIKSADKVILPGVGSASAAMKSITEKGLIDTIQGLTQPVLGVCLGMQLMVKRSDESQSGPIPCLDVIPGEVERMQAEGLRLPHMGWNSIDKLQDSALFDGIENGAYFYFVHSFSVASGEYTLAQTQYGAPFSAALHKDNFYGVQFHPERSGAAGAKLLNNFVNNL